MTQYLEFNSEYRDRTMFEYPSEFVAEISQSGNKEKSYAKDPVSDASPILFWNSSFDDSTASLSITITGIVLTNTTSDNTTFLITASSGDLRAETNYYKKAILSLTSAIWQQKSKKKIEYFHFLTPHNLFLMYL